MSLLGNMDITQVMYGCHAQHVNGQLIFFSERTRLHGMAVKFGPWLVSLWVSRPARSARS